MQSGNAKSDRWVLDFAPDNAKGLDPLMGWTSSGDTRQQVKLSFDSKEEALAYARANGIPFELIEPKDPKRRNISYSDNFRFNRVGQWTH
jgi:hypothetical protein